MNSIIYLRNKFNCSTGFSDHSEGIEASIAAVAIGSVVIEKHFTLDNHMVGPDHSSSLNPEDFGKLVKAIRNVELSLGNGMKVPSNSEKKNIKYMRRSLVAKVPIKKGEKFSKIALNKYGVALVPGTSFGDNAYDFVRISYANSLKNIEEAIKRISKI